MRRTILFLSLLLAAPAIRTADAGDALVVIVHPSRKDMPRRAEIARIFLLQRRFWSSGEAIVPVNRESGSEDRETFSRLVIGRSSTDLAAYWNEQYFQGVFPPLTLSSDASVKRYVASEAGAIGYIDEAQADDTVRVILKLR
ncbi:MAG: phosphate ABC transporter substrate-binding protein [Deltaproteobacteria bacterium]|nr:phosphate ABC transporter substrate-binding protein [Deltaproteobacteria bacterium]